ncbi:MAG: glycosyltransferase family 2 protein [Candidatus Curtissbacteria bacterium]|nr:glycosyltransferase family 2 protein [Candidatus Curtissbacteria bacterium]
MKAVIIVPALNESPVIFKVLKSLPKKINGSTKVEVLVVDDGSSDNTFQEARRARVHVIRHLINRGLGAAIKTGMHWAQKNGADIAVTFDADGQHNPKDINKIIEPIISKKADVAIGSRFRKKQNVPFDRFIINWLANFVTLLLFGVYSTDSQSGLRAFSKKALAHIDFKADRMEFSSEILLEAKRNNLKVKEVPVSAIYTQYSRRKGQKNTNAIPVFLKSLIRLAR